MANVARYRRRGRRLWRCDYLDAGGVRRRKQFATKEEAELFHATVTTEGREHLRPEMDPSITVEAYAADWLKLLSVKQATRETYAKHLRLYVFPTLGSVPIRDVRRPKLKRLLTDFLVRSKDRDSRGHATARLTIAVVRKLLQSAVEDQLIVTNPASGLGRAVNLRAPARTVDADDDRLRVKAMTRSERDLFLKTAREADARLWRLWALQVLTGLRPGEVYALSEADLLDLDGPAPRVRVSKALAENGKRLETTPKGGLTRNVDLSAGCIAILRAHLRWRKEQKIRRGWRDLPEPLFFAEGGGYHLPCDVRKRMKVVLEAAGLPLHFSPHALRHTFATVALGEGRSVYYVSKMLGHKDINLTVGTYTRGADANQVGALDALDPAGLSAL